MRHGTYAAVHLDLTERATHLGTVVNGWNSPDTASRQPGGVGSRGALNCTAVKCDGLVDPIRPEAGLPGQKRATTMTNVDSPAWYPDTETGPAYERPVQLPTQKRLPAPFLVLTLIELLGKIVLNPHLPDLVELRLQPVQVLLFILQDRLE